MRQASLDQDACHPPWSGPATAAELVLEVAPLITSSCLCRLPELGLFSPTLHPQTPPPSYQGTPQRPFLASGGCGYSLASHAHRPPSPLAPRVGSFRFGLKQSKSVCAVT